MMLFGRRKYSLTSCYGNVKLSLSLWFYRSVNNSGIQHVLNAVSVLLQMIYAALHLPVHRPCSVLSEMDIVTASVQCPPAQSGAIHTTSPLMELWPTFRYELVKMAHNLFFADNYINCCFESQCRRQLLNSQVYSKEV